MAILNTNETGIPVNWFSFLPSVAPPVRVTTLPILLHPIFIGVDTIPLFQFIAAAKAVLQR